MALTAMDIYQLLPQTNCGDCGFPTCLAFAMQLANKQASLDDCPDVSDEARAELDSASQPPIRLVEIGSGQGKVEIGNETVMFRHEETFHNACGLAVTVSDALDDDTLESRLEEITNLWFERIGEEIGVELIAVSDESGDPDRFAEVVGKVNELDTQSPILVSFDPAVIRAAFEQVDDLAESNPLIYAADEDNYTEMAALASEYGVPLAVYAEGLDALAELTPKIKEAGVEDLVLDTGSRDPLTVMQQQTQIRRQALQNSFRPLGYPTITFAQGDKYNQVMEACTYISKYAGIIVLEDSEPWQVLPLTVLRQNIYTDPRVPPTVEAKLYEVGEVTPESPVLLTTNFALTYFTVSSEVETSRIPAYILAVDTEGQSVLTAYAAENLTAENAAQAIKDTGLEDLVDHQEIIIPGYIAVMSGALEAESGWDVEVGPREASGIPAYLRNYTKA